MGRPLYAARLEDLHPHDHVKVSCNACSHAAMVPVACLAKGRPGWFMVKDLNRLFRCKRCNRLGDVDVDAMKALGNR
jgi:hypothetical protein